MLVLFPEDLRKKCIEYLDNDNKQWQQAWALVNKNAESIRKDREYYKDLDIIPMFRKFGIG